MAAIFYTLLLFVSILRSSCGAVVDNQDECPTSPCSYENEICYINAIQAYHCLSAECQRRGGYQYIGKVSKTKKGKTCQRWDSQLPHYHVKTYLSGFPLATNLSDVKNYCRNPDGEPAAWCFTTDPAERWDFCPVPECGPHENCQEVYNAGYTKSGVYGIKPNGVNETYVHCDLEVDGGGWTVIQQRINGAENFTRGWSDYKKGFGKASSEYWLGNDNIHALTADHRQTLRVELQLVNETRYANYATFWIDNEANNYKLTVGGYTGTAGDALAFASNGYSFSTWDKVNDGSDGCASVNKGGWWFNWFNCASAHLNGLYTGHDYLLYWFHWRGSNLGTIRMMVRPK